MRLRQRATRGVPVIPGAIAAPGVLRVAAVLGLLLGAVADVPAQDRAATTSCADCQTFLAPVATRHLPRGTVLSESDLRVARVAVRGLHADLPGTLSGWVTRRTIRAGEVLRPPAIARRPLVPRGSTVDVAIRVGEVEVMTRGVATRDAEMDDAVAVRLGPKRTVQGRVQGPGHVLLIDSLRTP
ncbi:MAG: flagellar basal body P-ring formation protein FlgA [Gemmatimonadetes bacterium]|nr:flagellar basal body P-ring formation protein FlgA [Gemmatimonadota bacterium]